MGHPLAKIPGPRTGDMPDSFVETLISTITFIPGEGGNKRASRVVVPEQVLFPGAPLQTPEYEWPPEFLGACAAHGAYVLGDERPLRVWVERHIGQKPDSLMMVRLKTNDLGWGGELPLLYLFETLKHHRDRLVRKGEAARIERLAREVRRGIKRYGSVNVALDALRVRGQTREGVLEEVIPGMAYLEREELPPGANLAGRVARQIRREGIEQPHDPGKVFPTDPEHLLIVADELGLAAFGDRELLAREVHKAGLSEQEIESFVFGVLLGNEQAGTVLRRSANQVAQEKFRAITKLRPTA
jgi:hypothetical protein